MSIQLYKKIIDPYITGKKQTCSYCDYLEPLVLLEGKYTYITLVIGQFVDGYVQICCKNHKTSSSGLDQNETKEFELMKEIVRESYKKVYSNNGVMFEHGKAGTCLWKSKDENKFSLCHHCHMHCIPRIVDIRDSIKKYLDTEIIVNNIDELVEIRNDVLFENPYLYFEDYSQIGYVYPVDDEKIPRQFLRTCIAEKLGIKEKGDWIKYPGIERFENTKKDLEYLLNDLYNKKINLVNEFI